LRKAGLSYAEIGRRWGISRDRVRQIVKGKQTPEKPTLNSKIVLRIGEVAQLLGLHPNTVRRWSNKGILKSYRINPRGHRRYQQHDVVKLLKEGEIE